MGQKDLAEKLLEEHNDVFADIMNVLLFQGEQIVSTKALKDSKTKTQYKADDSKLHELERDVVKVWKKSNIQLAICGIENQTKAEKFMPLRVVGYDGVSYRQQLLKENKKKMPVVTMVLYFGKAHWSYPKSLKELIPVPKELEPFVNDYKINVFEISWLTDEQVNMFQSDFRIIADFFVQKRKNKGYIPSKDTIAHVDEFLKLMEVLTGDNKYNISFSSREKKRGISMCDVVKQFEEKGKAEGLAEGLEKGELIGKVKTCKEFGLNIKEIAERLDITVSLVQSILAGKIVL